jgi:hypothetical protein
MGYSNANIFEEVIPGVADQVCHAQKILKPRGLGGLGKARIPKALG